MKNLLKLLADPAFTGFLGIICGCLLTYLFAIRINRRYQKAIAVSEFRAAFTPAIVKFKITSDFNEIDKILREELIPQGIAIERFRPFVKDKEAYQEAWENYHQSHRRRVYPVFIFFIMRWGTRKNDLIFLMKEFKLFSNSPKNKFF